MNKKVHNKHRLREIAERVTGITLPSSSVTVCGGCEVTLTDCERILVYETDRIAVKLSDYTVELTGSSLSLETYRTDCAVVRGIIDSVSLKREEAV